jgi:PAS domain S-box-containing protein
MTTGYMANDNDQFNPVAALDTADLDRFAESYASFNRVINSLQRQYLEVKEEVSVVNASLAESNRKLLDLTAANLAANDFLGSILNALSAAVIAVDRDGIITHFNRAASVIFGIPVTEPMGRRYAEMLPLGEPSVANAVHTLSTGEMVDSIERRITLEDGTRLHLSVSTEILHDRQGRPVGAVEICHDVTKLKKLEQEIARLNTLAALGEMAATIAHEVRNPLAGIGGFAVLLQRDLAATDPAQKLVGKIIRGTETLNRIVTTLLNYTRTDELHRDDVRFDAFLSSVIETFRQENGERVARMELLFVPPSRGTAIDMIVSIDPVLFRQVITNILSNAVDACGGTGEVTLHCSRLPRQRATRQYGDKLLLGLDETLLEATISDTGRGIDPESISKVFAPFYTTKNGGTGLGLAMARKIIMAHGGEILASNNADHGAKFTLLLPVRIDPTTSPTTVRESRTGRVIDEV